MKTRARRPRSPFLLSLAYLLSCESFSPVSILAPVSVIFFLPKALASPLSSSPTMFGVFNFLVMATDFLVMAVDAILDFGSEFCTFLKIAVPTAIFFVFLFAVAIPAPPAEPPLSRRERRAPPAAVRRSPPSPTFPVPISAYDIEVITRRGPPPPQLRSISPTKSYPSAIDDIVAKKELRGLKPEFQNGLIVDWVPIAPKRASLVTAEMVARPAASRPSTPVVAAPADLATDASPRAGPVEPPQCHSAASAADAGRARVPTSTEGLVSRVVEPPQGDSAASAANPDRAHVPASTDGMARPTGIAPVAIVPTWTPSSGPVFLPPRAPHPLFTFRNWKPSTGVEYYLRPPYPLFAAAFASPTPAAPAPAPRPLPRVVVSPPSPRPRPPVVLSAPVPRPLPATLVPGASAAIKATPTPAPAPALIPRPPRHTRSRPAAALRSPAPTPAPAPAPAPAPTTSVSIPPAPIATPPVLERSNQLDTQDWMAPLDQILTLDIQHLGLTEDELMAWEIPPQAVKAARKRSDADEALAQKDPLTMARRYGAIARELKRAAVMIRLQLLRVPAGRFPSRGQFSKIFPPMHEAGLAFENLLRAGGDNKIADFTSFRDAIRFIADHVMVMDEFEAWIVHHHGEVAGKRKADHFEASIRKVGRFLGIPQPNIIAQLGLA
ncbi:hypothetical protein P171DRAFT_272900 [Karstenula rhodostoma CBS 690.94]|uniref:Uncharacterized protein n=1 Tax=Karstenula rhodostoma CBS 690.94 TaxID=1392251 RepID=A0A9P4PIM6_9PLEO|nr:hypothetical protein P171DRAFT_272900 [Karstenula rhodostoma CBS 690.94]